MKFGPGINPIEGTYMEILKVDKRVTVISLV